MNFLFAAVLSLLALQVTAEEPDWIQLKSKAGIQLSYRYNPVLEVKARGFYPGKPGSFLLLLRDTASVQRWLKQSKDATLLEGSTTTDWQVYTRFQSIWPVSPRDMVTCATIKTVENQSTEIRISDCSNLVAETPDYVRIHEVNALWTLTPGDKGFELQYQGSANPGGNLPAWLVKQLTLSSLHASFIAFKTELQRPQYQVKTAEVTR